MFNIHEHNEVYLNNKVNIQKTNDSHWKIIIIRDLIMKWHEQDQYRSLLTNINE